MLSIFNLDNYKEYLISYYHYECDNSDSKKENRRILIEQRYSDDDLLEIIHNTKKFIEILMERTINSNRTYIEFEISGDNKNIFTNCTGGYSPDTLIPIFTDDEDNYISKYLLKQFLGSSFMVDFDANVEEVIDEDDDMVIGSIYYTPKIVIVGNFKLLQEKYDDFQRGRDVLTRTLKKDNGQI